MEQKFLFTLPLKAEIEKAPKILQMELMYTAILILT
jgi:hypothetical protein